MTNPWGHVCLLCLRDTMQLDSLGFFLSETLVVAGATGFIQICYIVLMSPKWNETAGCQLYFICMLESRKLNSAT